MGVDPSVREGNALKEGVRPRKPQQEAVCDRAVVTMDGELGQQEPWWVVRWGLRNYYVSPLHLTQQVKIPRPLEAGMLVQM